MKIIIIGGVAGGATAAARLRRLDERAEIVLVERGPYISFANCGLPYHISGAIAERDKLLAALAALPGVTPFRSDANMVLVRIEGPGERAASVFSGLKAHGVLVKNISKMHPLLANCLRLTVGTADENRALLQALRQSL